LEINYALLTYDRQGYKEVLERVLTQMQDLKKQLEPRRKFKFSRPDSDSGAEIIK
jgi:glutamate/tyrosine decarboxylase-like PLP-dependent enzyme